MNKDRNIYWLAKDEDEATRARAKIMINLEGKASIKRNEIAREDAVKGYVLRMTFRYKRGVTPYTAEEMQQICSLE